MLKESLDANSPQDLELLDFLSSTTPNLKEHLDVVESQVDRLYRISELIRRDSIVRSRQTFTCSTEEIDDDPSLVSFLGHIRDKHPKLKENLWLQKRLGQGFSARRNFILKQQEMIGEPELNRDHTAADTESSKAATTYKEISEQGASDIEQASRSTFSRTTSIASSFGEGPDGELHVPALTSLEFNGVRLGYDDEFNCPFCREMQFMRSEQEWR